MNRIPRKLKKQHKKFWLQKYQRNYKIKKSSIYYNTEYKTWGCTAFAKNIAEIIHINL
jgi:outer membrane protein assembly factor BamD (BamD/ComL family)